MSFQINCKDFYNELFVLKYNAGDLVWFNGADSAPKWMSPFIVETILQPGMETSIAVRCLNVRVFNPVMGSLHVLADRTRFWAKSENGLVTFSR